MFNHKYNLKNYNHLKYQIKTKYKTLLYKITLLLNNKILMAILINQDLNQKMHLM